MRKPRKCPFCQKKIGTEFPDLYFNDGTGMWHLSHSCTKYPTPIKVFISVYGKTKQECIDNWNGVQHEEQESESL